jgi:hypothetical protein
MVSKIDLLGWDTVFAISYEQANQAIQRAKSTPESFKYTDPSTQVAISGNWDSWQITTGGDGKNLQLNCPVKQGTVAFGSDSEDLSGSNLHIQITLKKLEDEAARFDDPTAQKGTGTPTKIIPQTAGTDSDPAVSVISSNFPKVQNGLLKMALPQIFQKFLTAHLEEFNHTFSVLIINEDADKRDYNWLKPTSVSYACADSSDKSLNESVFAVLCMTQNNPVGANQHGIDNRILQNLPKDANSAFGISDTQVMRHIFAPGAVAVIQGSKPQDFHITNDNLTILNQSNITWGNFKLDDGNVVRPVIGAKRFQMTLQAGEVLVQITDATFDWPSWHGPGRIEVNLTLNQYFQFDLKPNGKGGYVFVPKKGAGTKNMTASVTVSKGVKIFDICIGIAGSLIGGVLGGVLGGAISAGDAVATDSATEGVVTISEDTITNAVNEADDTALQETEETAAEQGSDSIKEGSNPSYIQRFKTALWANKWKIFGGAMGALIGAQPSMISEYMVLAAKGDLESIPPFNNFAANCIGATHWPQTKGWDLLGARLQGPLVINGNLMGDDQ